MSVMVTTRSNGLPDDADEDTALNALGARHVAHGTRPEHYPVVGAALLDFTASIAGSAWTPDYERAWSAAFEIVAGLTSDAREN